MVRMLLARAHVKPLVTPSTAAVELSRRRILVNPLLIQCSSRMRALKLTATLMMMVPAPSPVPLPIMSSLSVLAPVPGNFFFCFLFLFLDQLIFFDKFVE